MRWDEFIKNIFGDAKVLAQEELIKLVQDVITDEDEFIQAQGEKLQRYLQQLADGEITKEQFENYVVDIRDLFQMQARKMDVAGKARVQYLAGKIQNLIIDRFVKLL